MRACLPLSLKYSPMAHPEYGARNWRGAASLAVAATTTEYYKQPLSLSSLTILATVLLFYPMAT